MPWVRHARGRPYAKTVGTNGRRLNGYQKGTSRDVETNGAVAELDKLGDGLRDLALHPIAAHPGEARPLMTAYHLAEPLSALDPGARHVALRFARLQKRLGTVGNSPGGECCPAPPISRRRVTTTQAKTRMAGVPRSGEVAG